ncbi:hypothetical protein B0H13DRAFT_2033366 [Mycena leptocephala]|nr:hypothetical protein B0H13DRAFT_2033366 [Mycena leptocephala]
MSTGLSVEGFTPFLVSVTVSAPLWGVVVAQANVYYRTYPNDTKALKYLVGICVILTTAQLAVLAYTVYFWLITCRLPQNYPSLGSVKRSMAPSYLTYFLTMIVQCFYAMRVWFVSNKNKYIVSAIIILSIVQMVGGFALCTNTAITNSLSAVYSRFNHISGSIQLGGSMLCDMLISVSLVYCLRGTSSSFKATRNGINKIILYAINTGIVTNIVALINLVTWLSIPDTNFTWAVFHFSLGKIYVNAMLVSLNARASIRKMIRPSDSQGLTLSTTFNIDAQRSHH